MFDHTDEHLEKYKDVFSGALSYDSEIPVIEGPLLVLAFTNRSGSNLLAEYMTSTGLFSGFQEHLNADDLDYFIDLYQVSSFPDFIKLLWSFTTPGTLYGIKAAWSQILALKKYKIDKMFSGGLRVIHIERQDVLAQAVSMSIAVQTKQWTSSIENEPSAASYEHDSISHFLDFITIGNARIREIASITRSGYIHTCYEEILRDPQSQLDRITKWLSLPRRKIASTPTLQRQSTDLNKEFADRYEADFTARLSADQGKGAKTMGTWSVNSEVELRASEMKPEDRQKFLDIPYYLHLWTKEFGSLNGKKVLDFGCGGGTSAAGIALLHGAEVHGVDINDEATECPDFLARTLGMDQPATLTFQTISRSSDIHGESFDCIFSWSVFEHVANRLYPQTLSDLFSILKPGGLAFVQISPLYFSPEGSHLWEIGYTGWQHLTNQISEVHADIYNHNLPIEAKDALWSMFSTLNRITADELVARFKSAGFELLREQRDSIDTTPPSELANSYTAEALSNYQIVALFRKPLAA